MYSDTCDDMDRSIEFGMGLVGMVITIHLIFLIVMWIICPFNKAVTARALGGVSVYLFVNACLGALAGVFVGGCFSARKLWTRIILYPIGGVILLAVLLGLAFPFAIIGIVIGTCAGGS